jgi:excisionase family DNA binding protein
MVKPDVESGPNPRVLRALHRLAEQLDSEVQEALDAARARQLAPIDSVLQRCQYLQARFLSLEPVRGLPKHLLRKPDGLAITADLAAGLKMAVEPHLLDACVRQLAAVIEMLRPFNGRPFARKMFGGSSGKKSKQAQEAASEEDEGLKRLEQAAAELVHLFRTAAESLESPPVVVTRKPALKSEGSMPNTLTPPQLAEQMGVHPDKIYAWIRSGELRATDTAIKRGGRPRYRIGRQDAEDFQRRRQNSPPPPSPRRKKGSRLYC